MAYLFCPKVFLDLKNFFEFSNGRRYKVLVLPHWEPGAGAPKYKILFEFDFLLKDLCALCGSPRYPPGCQFLVLKFLEKLNKNCMHDF